MHDSVPAPDVLGRVAGRLGRVRGGGAHAGAPTCRAAAERRRALPNAEGVFRPRPPDPRAAAAPDPPAGRGRRAAAEWTSSRLERVLGTGLRPRSLEAQRVEASTAVRALNRVAALGAPRAERVARSAAIVERRRELVRRHAPEPAALSLPWSTGPVEGKITKLKPVKRSMYGRANIGLLRQRLLAA